MKNINQIRIEAIQLREDTVDDCYEFLGGKGSFDEVGYGIDPKDGKFKINKNVVVEIGNWIVKTPFGYQRYDNEEFMELFEVY